MANVPASSLAASAHGLQIQPFAVSKKEAMRLVGMPKLVQRWLYYNWIQVVRAGGRGRETIIDYQSLKLAYSRYKEGEEPPPLPSEQRMNYSKVGLTVIRSNGGR